MFLGPTTKCESTLVLDLRYWNKFSILKLFKISKQLNGHGTEPNVSVTSLYDFISSLLLLMINVSFTGLSLKILLILNTIALTLNCDVKKFLILLSLMISPTDTSTIMSNFLCTNFLFNCSHSYKLSMIKLLFSNLSYVV